MMQEAIPIQGQTRRRQAVRGQFAVLIVTKGARARIIRHLRQLPLVAVGITAGLFCSRWLIPFCNSPRDAEKHIFSFMAQNRLDFEIVWSYRQNHGTHPQTHPPGLKKFERHSSSHAEGQPLNRSAQIKSCICGESLLIVPLPGLMFMRYAY